jgi:hypothetical protein
MLKIETTKFDPKAEPCMLSKEDLLIGASYKLVYVSCIGVVLPNFVKAGSLCSYTMF